MGFYSSLVFYRPTRPPRITTKSIAAFMQRVVETETLQAGGYVYVNLKFSSGISEYLQPLLKLFEGLGKEREGPTISRMQRPAWDLELANMGLPEMIARLEQLQQPIHEALIGFGTLKPEVRGPITRVNSPENTVDYRPCELGLSIGSIDLFRLGDEPITGIGSIGLSIGGPGYYFPWKFADIVQKASAIPQVQNLMKLCQSSWPVQAKLPTTSDIVARRVMQPEFWPYDALDLPWDWYWGPQES